MFSKILIANRGEIALRVVRACEELGIPSVVVYSELDRDAPHVRRAGEAYLIGPGPASESYLSIEKLLDVIERSGADAVHPGYGFLAENAGFAATLEKHGATFIGPSASAIEAMGSKTKARELMAAAGVPIVPGTTEPVESVADARRIIAESIGFPVAVKAAGGGGGKGFRVALTEDELQDAFEGAAREGEKFFADSTVYLERYLPDPRHVEVQILADKHGNVIYLGERDCSLQRRHQKLIEEAPGPAVAAVPGLREKIGKIGVDAAAAVSYSGAGTIEGLLQDGEYFFLKMNTRVQLEHCVTEMAEGRKSRRRRKDNKPRPKAAQRPHTGGDEGLSISLDPDLFAELFAVDRVSLRTEFPMTARMAVSAHRLLLTHDRDARVESAIALAYDIAESVRHPRQDASRRVSATSRRLVLEARAALADDPALTLSQVASALSVSTHHLSRTFASLTGRGIAQHRTELRLRAALDRLFAGEDNLVRLAADLGFADHGHLTRTIRRHTGSTPSQLRAIGEHRSVGLAQHEMHAR